MFQSMRWTGRFGTGRAMTTDDDAKYARETFAQERTDRVPGLLAK